MMRRLIRRVESESSSISLLKVLSAHFTLLCFTVLLFLKLDHIISYSWWIIFFPLFMFHRIVARGSFSFRWVPFHASVATHLLIAFEVLLCFFLETAFVRKHPSVTLKFVFFPLFAFELVILLDNFRILKALLAGYDVNFSNNAVWVAFPHFCVAISTIFFGTATLFTLQKLCGNESSLDWWELFIIFGIAECFAFLACIWWLNPAIPILVFQILLFMRLEGRPTATRFIPLYAVFSPIFLAQVIGVISASNLVEKIVIFLRTEAATGRYIRYAARARDSFHSRLLGWWSTDEGGREEQAHIFLDGSSRYNTFPGTPPEIVREISKKNPAVEVWRLRTALSKQTRITESGRKNYEKLQKRLQAALNEQMEITKSSQRNYGRPQNRRQAALDEQTEITESSQQNENICTICYEHERNTMLLPCEHIFCSTCSKKCHRCPFCRVIINGRTHVFDV
uniref:uncharacterized protein LOC122587127 n=1 Tax=Erigeron canadensis TaxID=72917 RepID=UPI001CB947EA|nr:uncharacterized protein LOC122587127 [Erigeron canadensis]